MKVGAAFIVGLLLAVTLTAQATAPNGKPGCLSRYDQNNDCIVNSADLQQVAGHFGVYVRGFLNNLVVSELGTHTPPNYRNWYIVVGGGGDARTYQTMDSFNNFTNAVVGDWALTYDRSGQADPCCLTHDINGPSDCVRPGPRVLGHEALNTMECSFFSDSVLYWPDHLEQVHKDALQNSCNSVWLHSP